MGMQLGRGGAKRSLRSRMGSALGLGSAAALVIAGVALVGVLPAAASANLSFTNPPTTANANAGITLAVLVGTGGGNADHVTLSSSNCTLTPSGSLTQTTTSNPQTLTFSGIILGGASTGSCTVTATDTDAGGTASTNISVTSSTASKLVFTTEPASTTPANTALPFTVRTEDQYGNLVTSAVDSVVVTSACTLGGGTTLAETGGVASFTTLTINQVGSCYLTATDSTNSGVSPAVSSVVTISGGAPGKVVFNVAPPASVTTTGTVVTAFKAAVEDANGNIDTTGTGSTDAVTVSSPCLAAPVTATAIAGVATFSTVEFATTGACVLTATDGTRVIAAASATVQVGEAQPALVVTTKTGYLDAPLTLASSGGAGTGAVTFTVTNGTATGCVVTANVLKATKAGTCLVTATKAAVTPYATATSVATTVTFSSAPKALRVVGLIANARRTRVTITGYNFSGRPASARRFRATPENPFPWLSRFEARRRAEVSRS
jgi:hypothetical protein